MQQRFRFRHVNELVGLFVLLALAAAIAALFLAARSQQWFAATIRYRLQLPASGAAGLKPGNDVFVLGLPAGIVKNVAVLPNGRLVADIVLRRDFAPFIRPDSRALLKRTFGVAGDAFVELTRGQQGEPLADGDTILCQSSDELPSIVDRVVEVLRSEVLPVVQKTGALVEEWTRVGVNLNQTQADLRRALQRLDRLAARAEAGEGTVGRLLTDTNAIGQAELFLAEARQTLADLRDTTERVREAARRLPEIAEHLRQGTAELPRITRSVAAETRDLPGLVLQIQQTAAELQRLTEAIERHWLIRKYVEPEAGGGRIAPAAVPGGQP
ncbi:MAG: MCE family protein [Verrucomicrobia bacterium]|nr:MAG: MCE family protein [Verrucomicrobiota bacterium]